MRSKFIFLHVHIYFDMQKCEFSLKHSNSNCWLCFETGVLKCKKKKCYVNLDVITFQRKSHNNSMQKINL